MRTTKTMKNISRMYEGMLLDEEQVFRKSKLILAIYRDVVWCICQLKFPLYSNPKFL